MLLNHPKANSSPSSRSMEKLSSMKPVPGAKRIGGLWLRHLQRGTWGGAMSKGGGDKFSSWTVPWWVLQQWLSAEGRSLTSPCFHYSKTLNSLKSGWVLQLISGSGLDMVVTCYMWPEKLWDTCQQPGRKSQKLRRRTLQKHCSWCTEIDVL